MPPGTSASYREDGVFDFPIGTILAKSFAFPGQRLPQQRTPDRNSPAGSYEGGMGRPSLHLERKPDRSPPRSRARSRPDQLHRRGRQARLHLLIPNANECKQCHDNNHAMLPIGLKARNLNKDFTYADGRSNQLTYWTTLGYLQGATVGQPIAKGRGVGSIPTPARWRAAPAPISTTTAPTATSPAAPLATPESTCA